MQLMVFDSVLFHRSPKVEAKLPLDDALRIKRAALWLEVNEPSRAAWELGQVKRNCCGGSSVNALVPAIHFRSRY